MFWDFMWNEKLNWMSCVQALEEMRVVFKKRQIHLSLGSPPAHLVQTPLPSILWSWFLLASALGINCLRATKWCGGWSEHCHGCYKFLLALEPLTLLQVWGEEEETAKPGKDFCSGTAETWVWMIKSFHEDDFKADQREMIDEFGKKSLRPESVCRNVSSGAGRKNVHASLSRGWCSASEMNLSNV